MVTDPVAMNRPKPLTTPTGSRLARTPAMKLCAVVVALVSAIGCGDDIDSRVAVSETASTALGSSLDLASAAHAFKAPATIATVDVVTAAPLALTEVQAAVGRLVALFDCVTIDSDNTSYIEIQFNTCEAGMLMVGTHISSVAASGVGVERCARMCPRAGTVTASFDSGELVRWSYDGTANITVTAPRGVQLPVTLPCGR